MTFNIADRWVCAGWFQPSEFVEFQGDSGHWHVVANPAYGACGDLSSTLAYFLIAAIVAAIVIAASMFLLSYYGKDGESVFYAAFASLLAGVVWPLTTLLLPGVVIGVAAWRLAKSARARSRRRTDARILRDAEDAKRLRELAPYVAQLEKEMSP